MSMLDRAGIPYALSADYDWLETPRVRFFFKDCGMQLVAVKPSDPLTSAHEELERLFQERGWVVQDK